MLVVACWHRTSRVVLEYFGAATRSRVSGVDTAPGEAHRRYMGFLLAVAPSAPAGANGAAESADPLKTTHSAGTETVVVTHHHREEGFGGVDPTPPSSTGSLVVRTPHHRPPQESPAGRTPHHHSNRSRRLAGTVTATTLVQVAPVVPNQDHRKE